MTTMTLRSYAGETDLKPITDLIDTCETFDQTHDSISLTEMRSELNEPRVDQQRDIGLWEDGDGRLVGFATIWMPEPGELIDGFLWFKALPDVRTSGLESEIIAWGEARMREVGQETGLPVQLRSGAVIPERGTLLEQHGFQIARYFQRMTRPLDQPIPEPVFPAGYSLSHLRDVTDATEWVACFNQSFIDHYNHHDMSVETRTYWMREEQYRFDLDLVALAPDGTYAAVCWCKVNPDDIARTGKKEGWIDILGTRRGHRRIGLGRAMLLAGLHLLKDEGMDTAKLGVDADSLTGATRLYESVGFTVERTSTAYKKDL